MKRILLFFALALASFVLAPACKSSGSGAGGASTVSDGGADGEAGVCTSPPVAGNPACEACQVAKCCITASTCASNPDCVAIEACLGGGGDGGSCASGHAMGVWAQSGLDVCRQNQCAAECGLPAATCGAIVPDPASCLAAVDANCCAETAACGASDACVAFIYECLDQNACGTTGPCWDACRAMYPSALPAFDAMAACWGNVSC